jgi:hypothetical protein
MEPAPARSAPPDSAPAPDDRLTMALIGGAAYVSAAVAHETIGHGAACLASGGRVLLFSSVHIESSVSNSFIDLAGPTMGLVAGGIFWGLLRGLRRTASATQLFLWLAMSCNLLWATGYLPYSGVVGAGDWLALIQGRTPGWFWISALVGGGALAYVAAVWLVAAEMRRFTAGTDPIVVRRRCWRMVLTAYLAGGLTACAAGALDPNGAVWAILNNSAPASFLAGVGLLVVPWLRSRFRETMGASSAPVVRSRGWLLAGTGVIGVFVAVLGPGIRP